MKSKLPLFAVFFASLTVLLHAGPALPIEDAAKKLKAGAVLVDVRTPAEYAAKHVAGSTNIPLDTIKSGITNAVPDKSTVVLLHCKSGRRSELAEKELRAMGYTNAFNIGSYEKADVAVKSRDK
jgi:phage shock protein E